MPPNFAPEVFTYPKAERRELYRSLHRLVTGRDTPPGPVTFEEMRERLHLFQQSYGGLEAIPVARIVGSAARGDDFDEDFLPTKPHLKKRWESLEWAFPEGNFPPIQVYRVNDVYFVIDGHHRVGIAKHSGVEYIDAEITVIHTDLDIHDALSFRELIGLEMRQCFMRESGLASSVPDADIHFTQPEGYAELLEHVRIHGYHMMIGRGEVLPPHEIARDWYEQTYRPAIEAIRQEGLVDLVPRQSTEGDLFLWVHHRRRSLFTSRGALPYPEVVRAAADAESGIDDDATGGWLHRARRFVRRPRSRH